MPPPLPPPAGAGGVRGCPNSEKSEATLDTVGAGAEPLGIPPPLPPPLTLPAGAGGGVPPPLPPPFPADGGEGVNGREKLVSGSGIIPPVGIGVGALNPEN